MDVLKNFDEENIKLLHRHKVLYPLIQSIFYSNIIGSTELSPAEKDDAINYLWNKNQLKDEKDYVNWLEENKLSKEEVEKKQFNEKRFNKLALEKFAHKVESRFLKRKSELDFVVYSLIRIKDVFQAREIYLRLKEKESDFNDLAYQYSEGLEQSTRGVIGPIALNKAHPKVIEVLTSIKVGEIHRPINVDNWQVIIRLEAFNQATLDPLMKLQIAKDLMSEWVNDQSKSIMKELLRSNN